MYKNIDISGTGDIREVTLRPQSSDEEKILRIFLGILSELDHADTKHQDDKMSPKEIKSSFLTIAAELKELEREVERVEKRPELMHKEALQVSAMGIKFIRDVCP